MALAFWSITGVAEGFALKKALWMEADFESLSSLELGSEEFNCLEEVAPYELEFIPCGRLPVPADFCSRE